MQYDYHCAKCNKTIEISKHHTEIKNPEYCKICNTEMKRLFTLPKIYLSNDIKVQDPYFSPSLGVVVKDDKHARRIAKEKGLIEVGNEIPSKHIKRRYQEY